MFRSMDCTNCSSFGHSYSSCPFPITSYGVIVYNDDNKFLMIRRRDSFGFIDFVKGKYSLSNFYHITNSIDQMSNQEKQLIQSNVNNFATIWERLFECSGGVAHSHEFSKSLKKFEALIRGISINGQTHTLEQLFQKSTTNWHETEWEFPKGRKLKGESELTCALREFEEETGINSESIEVLENVLPLEEIFVGSNHRPYKHKYFVAKYTNKNKNSDNMSTFQKSEVSKLEWKTYEECISCIRSYNIDKTKVLANAHDLINFFDIT
jgi:ADP-ribose pyrophosphatase YjhB (NUDIX family)